MQKIVKELEEIANKMCDEYCKYPQVTHEKYLKGEIENVEDKAEYLISHYCKDCPLSRLA